MSDTLDPNFEGMREARRPQIKLGKVGDWFRGVVVDNTRQMENKLSGKHEMQTVYEFKAIAGSFHDIVDKVVEQNPTAVIPGEFYSFFAKGAVQAQLKNAKIGQVIGFKFQEERPASQPGFNPTKIVKVFLGDMDPNYQGETAEYAQ